MVKISDSGFELQHTYSIVLGICSIEYVPWENAPWTVTSHFCKESHTQIALNEEAGRALRSTSIQSSEPCQVAQYTFKKVWRCFWKEPHTHIGCGVSLFCRRDRTMQGLVLSDVCCSVLQRVATCCSVLQRVEACCSVFCKETGLCRASSFVYSDVCCSVLQWVAACCSGLQCLYIYIYVCLFFTGKRPARSVLCIYIRVYLYLYVYTYIYICIFIWCSHRAYSESWPPCINVCIYKYIYMYTYIYICIYKYIYIYI